LVELLLAHGADPAIRTNDQLSPLDVALLRGADASARVLADHGSTIDLKSSRAAALLEAAIKFDLGKVIRAALAAGWSPHTKFRDVWPALAVARACRAKDCAAALEQAGADSTLAGAPLLASAREIDAAPRLIAGVAAEDFRDPDTIFPASLVTIDVVLDSQGHLQFPVISTHADWRLDYAAILAVSGWRFTPVTKGGQPVAVRLTLPVEFPASTSLAIKPDKADLLPVPIKRDSPIYPDELSRSGQIGRVNVSFTVGADGRVRSPRVRASSHPAFRQPALDAVAKWIFKPGMLDGKPVPIRFEQEIVFSLD
jgi:TonB family protein